MVLLQSVFQRVLLSAQGFLKGSCDEVFWSDIIKHPKATERIKRTSSKPFHYWKVGIFPEQCPQMPLELLLMCQQREHLFLLLNHHCLEPCCNVGIPAPGYSSE